MRAELRAAATRTVRAGPRAASTTAPPRPRPRWARRASRGASGSQTSGDARTCVDRHRLPVHRVRIVDAVARGSSPTRAARVAPGDVALAHQPLGAEGEVAWRGGELRPPRATARRSDERIMPRGIFSMPRTSTRRSAAIAICAPRRGASAAPPLAAAGFDVDDRHAREAERGQHLVPGGDAAVDGAAEGRRRSRRARSPASAQRRADGVVRRSRSTLLSVEAAEADGCRVPAT